MNLFNAAVQRYVLFEKGPHCLFINESIGCTPAGQALNLPASLGVQRCFGEQLVTDGNSAGGI